MSITKPTYNEIFFSEEELLDIKQRYLNKETASSIGKVYGVSHHVIVKALKRLGIWKGRHHTKYDVNDQYFDVIDSQDKAYILGFLCADGYNGISKGTVTMSLQEDDYEILEKIRLLLDSTKPLEFLDYSNKTDFGYQYKNQYRLTIHSSHMCKTLYDYGIVPNKSNVLLFPSVIPLNLYSHFIRGYFDGDGSLFYNGTKITISITGTSMLLEVMRDIIERECNINVHIYDASNHNGITKVLIISGNKQTKVALDYIYYDAKTYMERKYNRYYKRFYENGGDLFSVAS